MTSTLWKNSKHRKTPFTKHDFWLCCYLHPPTFFALLIPKKNALDFEDIVSLLLINSRDSREDWQLILLCCCQPSPEALVHTFSISGFSFQSFLFRFLFSFKDYTNLSIYKFLRMMTFHSSKLLPCSGSDTLQRISDTCLILVFLEESIGEWWTFQLINYPQNTYTCFFE